MQTNTRQTCNISSGKCPPENSYCASGECNSCSQSTAKQVYCNDLSRAQSAMRSIPAKGERGPSLTNVFTPISFLPKGQGLSETKPLPESSVKLPKTWSWRKDGQNMISPVSNQCQCGCCWAVASTSALADRFGVKGTSKYEGGKLVRGGAFPDGIEAPDLSAAWTVMAIGPRHGGPHPACQCQQGGSLAQASCGFEQIGVKLESCYPFSLFVCQNNANEPAVLAESKAPECCIESERSIAFKIVPGSTEMIIACAADGSGLIDEEATHNKLKAEIANRGPVPATFLEYSDFQADNNSYYQTQVETAQNWEDVGVYVPKTSYGDEQLGGHAVVITGWGTKDGQEFWEVRNSWGVAHGGGEGYFKYAIVKNDACHLAVPAIVNTPDGTKVLAGGAISFLPGDLPDGFTPKKGTGKRRSPDDYRVFGSPGGWRQFFHFKNPDGSLNWPFILVVTLVAAIVVALLVQLIPKKD